MTRLTYIFALISASIISFGYFILWVSPDRPGSWKKAEKLRRLAFHLSLWFSALLQIAMFSFGLGAFLLTAPFYYFMPFVLCGSIASSIVTVEVLGTIIKGAPNWSGRKRIIIISVLSLIVLVFSTTIAQLGRTKLSLVQQPQETPTKIEQNLSWLNNTIWEFPGGEMETSRIIFRPDGHIVFEGGFATLNPAYWQYDEIAQELYFIIPNVTDDMISHRIKRGRGEVKRVDRSKRSRIYDFDTKTEVFDFMGWNYFKKRE